MKSSWLLLFLVPVVVVGVNVYVDPANVVQFSFRFEKRIADFNLSGSNVIVPLSIADYDERIYSKIYLEGTSTSFDVVSLGSSRTRQFYREDFPDLSFHNFAMAAANLEDLVTFSHLINKKVGLPRLLIVGVEHWMLDKDAGYTHWQSLRSEYHEALGWLELPRGEDASLEPSPKVAKWFELVNPAYFQASLRQMFSGKMLTTSRIFAIEPTQQTYAEPDQWLQKADGSAGELVPPRTLEEVDVLVRTRDDGVSPLRKIDESRALILRTWVRKLRSLDNVKVCFFLAPVHPLTYSKWVQLNTGIKEAESFYRNLAAENGIYVFGSYNPELVKATAADFFDWVHPRRPLLKGLANQVYQKFADRSL